MNLVTALKHLPITAQPLSVRRVVSVVNVKGVSMGTALISGNSYPVEPIKGELTIGTIVVVATKHKWFEDVTDSPPDYIVKRVAGINADGSVYLLGDNGSRSWDSRLFGFVNANRIAGEVIV